jgi:UDP-N-acetyl-alpha-D-muramoyl-L-alanyl-L-glutamate epimerase
MPKNNNQEKFERLRQEFPFLAYNGFDHQFSDKGLRVQFHYSLSDRYLFHPTHIIPAKDFLIPENINDAFLENILFHIGMVEAISYWKAACPPKLIIKGRSLTKRQTDWWKKLFFKGLGEFRYLNSIKTDMDSFLEIEDDKEGKPFESFLLNLDENCVIPVGGGKDSVVTIELLGNAIGNVPMILNPREASKGTIMKTGRYYDSILEVNRTIDPVLLELNEMGFLNGHTPFSALLAFVSVLAAGLSGKKYIALSNESSANEATVPGSEVNHQYSKSFEFEKDFRSYIHEFITPEIEYFSFLRPLNELQIARFFSGFPNHFDVFRSCNAGSKNDAWCGKCAKCLFTFVILSPFIDSKRLETIFGKNLLNDSDLWPVLQQLTGIGDTKPFDCIGTIDEVNGALQMLAGRLAPDEMPVLLKRYLTSERGKAYRDYNAAPLLNQFNPENALPEKFKALLISKINA